LRGNLDAMSGLEMDDSGDGVALRLRVSPGARGDALRGVHGAALKVAVAAPPEDGRANAAVCALLAGVLGIPARQVTLLSGHASRDKRVLVTGLTSAELAQRIHDALQ
jgi:uncharacterized protein